MSDSESPQDSQRQAREFHGFVRMLEDLGNAAESVFSRLYGMLSARDKVMVDAQALQDYKASAEIIQERVRRQTMEIARMTGILGQIEEGVIMQDPNGRIILMNEPARQLIGSSKNLWQSDLGQLFRTAQGTRPSQYQMQMVGEPTRVPVNDHMLGVRLAAIHSEGGDMLGTVMLVRDVTQGSIEERVNDSIVGRISHELRTPLASIQGASDILLNTPEGQPPQRRFLDVIRRNVATLDRMVVELLDISEISGGSFEIRQDALRLDEVAFTVLKGFETEMAQSEINSTSMVANPRVLNIRGDTRRLQWAIGHLVDNAVKYNLPGGNVTLQMGQVRDNRVLLEVVDTGVGIANDDLPRIFERFYRGIPRTPDGRQLDPRGLGQGLYIADAVLQAHGGFVTVNSTPGRGSTFTIEIPIAA